MSKHSRLGSVFPWIALLLFSLAVLAACGGGTVTPFDVTIAASVIFARWIFARSTFTSIRHQAFVSDAPAGRKAAHCRANRPARTARKSTNARGDVSLIRSPPAGGSG